MATQTIQIVVTDRGGARTVSRNVAGIGAAADRANAKTGKLVGTLRNVATVSRDVRNLFLILGAAKTFKFAKDASDEFKRINNTLRGFEVGAKNIDNVRKQIKAVANESRVGAKETAVFFGRLRKATKDLGLSDRQVLQLTGTAQKALRLGGASATEATQAVRQLTQAFNKGKLDGDEFRSTLENAPVLAELLSEKLGVTKNVLRDMAEDGKITTEVLVGALQDGADKIDQLFGTLETTSDDAFTQLRNNTVEFVGELDRATGASAAFIGLIQQMAGDVGGNLNNALTLAGTALGVFAVKSGTFMKLSGLGIAVRALVGLNTEIDRASGGTRNLASLFADVAGWIRTGLGLMSKLVQELLLAAGIKPGKGTLFETFADALAQEYVVRGPEGRKEVNRRAVELMKADERFQKIDGKETPVTKALSGFTNEKLREAYEGRKAPFYEPAGGIFNPQPGGVQKMVESAIGQMFTEVFQPLARDSLRFSMEKARMEMPGGDTSYLSKGQVDKSNLEFEEVRRVRAADELQSKLLNIQGILDKASESQGELAKQAADIQGRIVNGVKSALSGEAGEAISTEQLTEYANKAETLLKQIEDTSGNRAVSEALQENLRTQIKQLDDLKAKIQESKSLKDEEKTAAIATIDQTAQEAHAILVAATTETAGVMKQVYIQVLQELRGLAASLPGTGGLGLGAGAGSVGGFGGITEADLARGQIDSLNSSLDASNEKLRTATEGIQSLGNQAVGSFGTASNAARGFGNTTNNIGNQIQNNFGQVFSGLENALVSFVQTGKLDFKSLIQSMLADLARLLIRMLIIQPLMGFFGGLFGFSGGGLVGGFSQGGFAGSFSGGGSVSGGSSFDIPSFGGGCPGGVCDLPGFATGTGMIAGFGGSRSDSMLARVSNGEFIVNAQDTRRNLPDLMRMNNGQSTNSSSGGGGAMVNNTTINVTVQSSGQNPGQDGAKIAKAIEMQMDKKLNEFTRQQRRPGGVFKQREA